MSQHLTAMLERYRADHQHPVNRALHMVGIPTIVASLAVAPFNPALAAGMFVLGWILQLVGHAIEGKAPTLFSDPRYLLVGPVFFVRKLLGRS